MSAEQNWKELGNQQDDDLASLLQPGRIQQIKTADPLQKIKNSLRYGIMWAAIICAMYILLLFYFPYWQVIITIGAVLVFTVWGGITAFILYKRIQPAISGYQPVLTEMEKQYNGIQAWVKLQLKAAIFVYPAASSGGFIIGLLLGSGKSIADALSKPLVMVALIIVTIVLVPCGLYLAKWMLNRSFGKHLAALKKNIEDLKAEK